MIDNEFVRPSLLPSQVGLIGYILFGKNAKNIENYYRDNLEIDIETLPENYLDRVINIIKFLHEVIDVFEAKSID